MITLPEQAVHRLTPTPDAGIMGKQRSPGRSRPMHAESAMTAPG